jgi:hypothetical protein
LSAHSHESRDSEERMLGAVPGEPALGQDCPVEGRQIELGAPPPEPVPLD